MPRLRAAIDEPPDRARELTIGGGGAHTYWRWLLGGLLASGIAALAYWRRALTLDGVFGATLVGGVVLVRGGLPAAAALLAFFVSSSALSRLGERRKQRSPLAQAKGARRDVWQVLANGGVAALCVGLGGRRGAPAMLGALATAAADTWATELGLLARARPRLITTLQTVAPGTSGGITLAGLAASAGGATLVGLAWSLLGGGRPGVRGAVYAGVCGSLIDSWLGATLQAAYHCSACDVPTEEPVHQRCGERTELLHGHRWMTNDAVNACATLAGALVGEITRTWEPRFFGSQARLRMTPYSQARLRMTPTPTYRDTERGGARQRAHTCTAASAGGRVCLLPP